MSEPTAHSLSIHYIDAWDTIAFEYDDVVTLLNNLGYEVEVRASEPSKAVITQAQTMSIKQKVEVTIF